METSRSALLSLRLFNDFHLPTFSCTYSSCRLQSEPTVFPGVMMQHQLCTSSHVVPCEEVSCFCWISFPWAQLWRGDNERRDLFLREPLTFSSLQLDVHDGKSVAASETNYGETIDHTGEEPHWLCSAWTSVHKLVCTSELDQIQTWKIMFSVNVLVHETTILCRIYPDLFKQLE